MPERIGLIHGEEETFPAAFLEEVNARRVRGLKAEVMKIGGVRLGQSLGYDVIVDRLSHRVRFFREVLKHAVATGSAACINDPLRAEQGNRFLRAELAVQAGLAVPKAVMLPSRDYAPETKDEDLQNLIYPLDWEEMLDHVGLPAVLRPIEGSRPAAVRVNNLKDLWEAYGRTGSQVAELTQWIERDQTLVVLCAGDKTIPVTYDPMARQFEPQQKVDPALTRRASAASRTLLRKLGLEMAGVELALAGTDLYLMDVTVCPVFDWWSLSEELFRELVGSMVDLAVERVKVRARTARAATPIPRDKNLSNTKLKT